MRHEGVETIARQLPLHSLPQTPLPPGALSEVDAKRLLRSIGVPMLPEALASSVKARASQAAIYVCGQVVQLHGAIGFTDEYELGIYVNTGKVRRLCTLGDFALEAGCT